MGQEFIIKSQTLEDKINQLLPSQGGFQAGVDLSASTQIIPIVDLTESAEGSNLRADLQTALSLNSITAFSVSNTTTTIINTTGFFRIFGFISSISTSAATLLGTFSLTDGTTTKNIFQMQVIAQATNTREIQPFDFNVFITAGDSVTVSSNDSGIKLIGSTRQIADINGNLVNPT